MSDPTDGYQAVSRGVGFVDRSGRARLDVRGPDRAKFLHNLTTNDVKRLPVGRGCEAFVTSPQGKTLGYVTLLAGDGALLLRTDPGGLAQVLPHLQKYGVFDDVALDEVSARTFEFHIAGPGAEELIRRAAGAVPPELDLAHAPARVADADVLVVREAPTGRPGLTVIGSISDAPRVAARLRADGGDSGLTDIDPAAFEALRIEAGTPVFGREVTPENLPQEIGRDARAINFVKGCYLGQETVARIDALGHVNKILKGLKVEGREVPPAGAALEKDGKAVGAVTSAAFSPGWGCPIALSVVRVQHARPGTILLVTLPEGPVAATVTDLPMLPPGGE